ncbi:DUF4860 domain-containing protein [Dielma fastidiosa]|uniref:Uncharacterized protein DUF4860 n=1 Tax=Dielma fastidiosa TaxID=1034346 RepID=A0A318L2Q7_9FIRM|nr:DUF4860 domain-containing protein [Dielma fastidiosa]PXX79793.1 uncharacterized protein DUF4860 [Dielma fastidiosa]
MKKQRTSTQFMSLLLYCLFAVCACMMVALSAQAYQQLQKNRQNDLNTMNVFSYINNKLRENDVEKGVTVLNIDQCSVLKLTSVEGDFETATYIYSKDGMLYEIYAAADIEVSLDDGQPLLACSQLSFELSESSVIIYYETADQNVQTMTKYLRAGE